MLHGDKRVSKVDQQAIKNFAIESLKFIHSWNNKGNEEYAPDTNVIKFKRPKNGHMPSVKRKYYDRALTHIKVEMYASKKKSDSHKLKLSTAKKYMGNIKKAIYKECNIKHPDLSNKIAKLIKKYPKYKYQLERIRGAHMKDVVDVKNSVKERLEKDGTILAEKLLKEIKPYEKQVKEGEAKINPLPVQHPFVKGLKLTDKEYLEIGENTRDNFAKKKNITIPFAQINRIMHKCLESNDFYELTTGVALATGRRAIEVMHTGIFNKSKKKNEIKFKGQAKKSKVLREKINHIPMLVDADSVISAVEKLRTASEYVKACEGTEDLTTLEKNAVINRRVASKLNKTVRGLFGSGDKAKQLTFHSTRTIAANIAWDKLRGNKSSRRSEFFANYEGHRRADGKTSHVSVNNYDYITIDYDANDVSEADETTDTINLSALEDMWNKLASDKITAKKAIRKLYDNIIENVSVYPFNLNQTSITKGYGYKDKLLRIGGGRASVKAFLNHEIVKAGIAQYHEDNKNYKEV